MSDPPRSPSHDKVAAGSQSARSSSGQRSRLRRVYSHRRRHLPLWLELPLLLLVAFCAAVLLRTFVAQSFDIPSGSMKETLQIGDRVLVNKIVYDLREPQRGEVVVFKGSQRWAPESKAKREPGLVADSVRVMGDLVGVANSGEKDLIKRIIGVPGDTVACCDKKGRVTVNGVPLNESDYVASHNAADLRRPASDTECLGARRFDPVTVPVGEVFVMGDNRIGSQDSRCQGFVPIENFIGRAVNVVWPKSSWSALEIPETFKDIPQPESPPPNGDAPGGAGAGEAGAVVPLLVTGAAVRRERISAHTVSSQ